MASAGAKRRLSDSERHFKSKSPKTSSLCSLRSCSAELDQEEGRVEVKSCLPSRVGSAFLRKCVVDWRSSGEAVFHKRCWAEVLRNARVRNTKNATMRIHPEERTLVKEAAKTAEFHDSAAELATSARRIASMMRKARFCIAFTGAGISTSAGIGEV